jgi:hypothetical protein
MKLTLRIKRSCCMKFKASLGGHDSTVKSMKVRLIRYNTTFGTNVDCVMVLWLSNKRGGFN